MRVHENVRMTLEARKFGRHPVRGEFLPDLITDPTHLPSPGHQGCGGRWDRVRMIWGCLYLPSDLTKKRRLEAIKQSPLQDLAIYTLKPNICSKLILRCTSHQHCWEANSIEVRYMRRQARAPRKQAATPLTVLHISSKKLKSIYDITPYVLTLAGSKGCVLCWIDAGSSPDRRPSAALEVRMAKKCTQYWW